MRALTLDGVTLHAHGARRPLLDGVSLTVSAGEIVAVIGASGAGKTTLLEVAAGLRAPDSGHVALAEDRGAAPGGARVGIAFQAPERTFFAATLEAEVGFALSRARLTATERRARVADALRLVGLDAIPLHRSPLSLSGGEQRLAALAAVVVAEPAVLLLDEPTAGLAAARAAHVLALLMRLRERGTGILISTHEVDTFAAVADRVVALACGRVVAAGAPAHVFAAERVDALLAAGVPVPVEALTRAPRVSGTHAHPPAARDRVPHGARTPAREAHRLALPAVGPGIAAGTLFALAFFVPAPIVVLAALAAGLPAAAWLAGGGLTRLARLLAPVALLGALAAVAHLWTNQDGSRLLAAGPLALTTAGADAAARSWLRIVGPVLAGLVVAGARPPATIARELRALLHRVPLARRAADDVALAALLTVRLLPLMRDEVLRIERAQRARGGAPAGRSLATRARSLVSVAVPALVSTLLRAQGLALALALRGWGAAQPHDREGTGVRRRADVLWPAVAAAALAAVLVLAVR